MAVVFSEGEPEVPGTTATRFLPGASAPVCSRGFAQAHVPLDTPEAMLNAGLLHDTDRSGWQAWLANAGCPENTVLAGPVFQDFNLLDTFSIQDNIFLPLVLAQQKYEEKQEHD